MSDVQITLGGQSDAQITATVPGIQGPVGVGFPSGGTANQVLFKQSSTNYDAVWGFITSAMIDDLQIVNADVSASAAIAGTKISPNFGSQTVTTTGVFSHALGTAGAPTITFTGDPNTGIYSPGADQVAVATNGTGRLFVDASGNVGVGVSPTVPFETVGTSIWRSNLGGTDKWQRFTGGSGLIYDGTTTNSAIGFITNGSERLRITAAGQLSHIGAGTSGSPAVSFSGSAASNSLVIDSNSRVGIGTSSPSERLHVAGNQFFSNEAEINASQNTITFRNTRASGYTNAQIEVLTGSQWWTGAIAFKTASASFANILVERMRITSEGLVGIGTTSAISKLHVSNSGAEGFEFTPGSAANTNLTTHYNRNGSFVYVANQVSAANHQFFVGASEAARIDSSGRLLVGTSTARSSDGVTPRYFQEGSLYEAFGICANGGTTPNSGAFMFLSRSRGTTLGSSTIVAAGDTLGSINFYGADGTDINTAAAYIAAQVDGTPGTDDMPGRLVFSTTPDGAAAPLERLRITQAGVVLIGTQTVNGTGTTINSTGSVTLAGSGTGSEDRIQFRNGNGVVGAITTSGTSTAYNTSSDYRLKENVTPVTDGITRLQQLKPSRFNFTADPDKTVDGFIAHEVQAVVPEAITGDKDAVDDDGNPVYQGIDQSKLVPLLTAALQEAIGEIESLKARVAALEAN